MSSLYPELIDLIIDQVTTCIRLETRGWLNGSIYNDICTEGARDFQEIASRTELKKCSLISKAWYTRARQYIWRTVTIHGPNPGPTMMGLVRFLVERPDLVALIRHVDLRAAWNVIPDTNDWIDDLARILSPVTTISLFYPPNQVDEEITSDQQNHSVLHHPFFLAITSPLTLNNLTSLNYEGRIFPVALLEHTPNLRDLSLQGPKECQNMHNQYRQPMTRATPYLEKSEKSKPSTLSFRLQRAHFCKVARNVIDEFVEHHPQVFSQLKELYLADFMHFYGIQKVNAPQDLPSLVLFMSTKDTLETLAIGVEMPRFSRSPPSSSSNRD